MTTEQDALIVRSLPSVRRIARTMLRHVPPTVDEPDLIAAGYLALVAVALRYDRARASFGTIALVRARGAMLDLVRRDYPFRGLGYQPTARCVYVPLAEARGVAATPQPHISRVLEDGYRLPGWIAHVPDLRGRAILRGELRGFQQDEIGRALGIPQTTISYLRKKAIEDIRRHARLS